MEQNGNLKGVYEPSLARTLVKPGLQAEPEPAPSFFTGSAFPQRRCGWPTIPLALAGWILLANLGTLLSLPHHPAPWHVNGPAPVARESSTVVPDMVGTWTGTFDSDSNPALLAVTAQSGTDFEGILMVRESEGTFALAVEGQVTQDNQGVRLDETRVLAEPRPGDWALGTDTGSLSGNGLQTAGSGRDTRDTTYDWSFAKQTDEVIVPSE